MYCSIIMNNLIKLFRCTQRYIYVFKYSYRPIKLTKPTNLGLFAPVKQLSNIFVSASVLTWLGFVKEDENVESELIMTIKRGVLLTQRGEFAKAEQMLHLALRLAQEQQNNQGVLYVYDVMANLALERGEADKAEILFVQVLQKLLADGMPQEDIKVIHISLKLARICHMKGDTEKAETGFKWCLSQLEKSQTAQSDQIALKAVIQDWYAQLLLDKNELDEALKHLKDAFTICKQIEGEESEKSILLLNDLGTASWKLGQLIEAEDYLKQAIQIGKKIDNFEYLGVIHANLGMVYLQKGILAEAQLHCKEGWRLGKKLNDPNTIEHANYCFEQMKNSDHK